MSLEMGRRAPGIQSEGKCVWKVNCHKAVVVDGIAFVGLVGYLLVFMV